MSGRRTSLLAVAALSALLVSLTTPATASVRPTLVGDLRPGPQGSHPEWLTKVGGRLYFVSQSGDGEQLWYADRGGTHLVYGGDARKFFRIGELTAWNGTLYFVENDSTYGS